MPVHSNHQSDCVLVVVGMNKVHGMKARVINMVSLAEREHIQPRIEFAYLSRHGGVDKNTWQRLDTFLMNG